MRAETAEDKRCAAEWAAKDLKSGIGWELEVEVEVEKAPGPVMLAALPTTESSPEGERMGVPGRESRGETPKVTLGTGRPGEEVGRGMAGEERGGGATEGGRKVERM